MSIKVTDEHFCHTYFTFYDENSIEKFEEMASMSIIGDIWKEPISDKLCISKRFMDMVVDFSWSNSPGILFRVEGVGLGDYEIKNKYSYYDGRENNDSFFNAEISLTDIDEWVVRYNDFQLEDIILLARNRWCTNMGLNYFLEDEAKIIEEKIVIAKEDFNRDLLNSDDTDKVYEDKIYDEYINYMRNMEYRTEYLQSEHWKHFRNETLKYYNYSCQICKKSKKSGKGLNVHHRVYDNKGRETFNDVIVVCWECHKKIHGK